AAHPSPLSAKKFFDSKPFSGANQALKELGKGPIDWQLPPRGDEAAVPSAPAPSASQVTAPSFVPEVEPAPWPTMTAPDEPPAPPELLSSYRITVAEPEALPQHTGLAAALHPSWQQALAEEFTRPYFAQLETFLAAERQSQTVYPAEDEVFAALN